MANAARRNDGLFRVGAKTPTLVLEMIDVHVDRAGNTLFAFDFGRVAHIQHDDIVEPACQRPGVDGARTLKRHARIPPGMEAPRKSASDTISPYTHEGQTRFSHIGRTARD